MSPLSRIEDVHVHELTGKGAIMGSGTRRAAAVTAAALAVLAQGCASVGGPGMRACAPYMLGGAAVGAGLGVSTASDRDQRARRGGAGAVAGAAAGYLVCTEVWKQKEELETQWAALDATVPTGTAAAPQERVVRAVEVSPDNDALRLDLNLMFATGQSRLEPRVASYLQVLASSLLSRPNSVVHIIGHTDSSGDPERNRTLSRSRAQAVAAYLAGQGVDRARLRTEGMGSDQPVADNTTQAGRARNRRVEVFILPYAQG